MNELIQELLKKVLIFRYLKHVFKEKELYLGTKSCLWINWNRGWFCMIELYVYVLLYWCWQILWMKWIAGLGEFWNSRILRIVLRILNLMLLLQVFVWVYTCNSYVSRLTILVNIWNFQANPLKLHQKHSGGCCLQVGVKGMLI